MPADSDDKWEGPRPGSEPTCVDFKWEGPVPPMAGASKPANSAKPRGNPASSQVSGPFGGKRPQS